MKHKIINWAGVSNALTSNPRQIRADYDGKKYAELVNELREFESKWLDRAKGAKEKRQISTKADTMNETKPLIIHGVSVSVCAKCGAETKHLKNGLCYGCTMLKG